VGKTGTTGGLELDSPEGFGEIAVGERPGHLGAGGACDEEDEEDEEKLADQRHEACG